MNELDSPQYIFARLAVDKAKSCSVDTSARNPAPLVAIVIAINDTLIGWCAKGVGGSAMQDGKLVDFSAAQNSHAEQALLENIKCANLSEATAYITLEPCTKKSQGTCCADLLVSSGIKEIYIGNSDPNPNVGALAWKTFLANGIKVMDFAPELRNEAMRDNHAFFLKFRYSVRSEDGASFDYDNNGGERVIGKTPRHFSTLWSNRGNGTIYALDNTNNVAIAKNCTNFDQIDDPARWFEDSHYTKPVNEGEIVIFRNEHGFALVKIQSVKVRTSSSNAELRFRYQLCYPDIIQDP